MKKLLSLLSVLTISGTAVPTTIAASPYQKQETIKNSDINYQQTNNLETLKRNKKSINKYEDINLLIEGLSEEVNFLALSIKENIEGYFNLLQNNYNANIFVSHLQGLSNDIKNLKYKNYNMKDLTKNTKNIIDNITSIIIDEMGNNSLSRYPGINGGAALKAISRNIKNLTSIIEALGKELHLEKENHRLHPKK